MCPFWGLAEGAHIPGVALLEETADGLEEKPNDTSAFQSSDGNASAEVPLAKPSQVTRLDPKSRFGKVFCTHQELKHVM